MLVTAHRPTNVDDPVRLARLVAVVRALAEQVGPVTFPVHPRTAARLAATGLDAELDVPGVTRTGPLEYDDLLAGLAASRLAVTDSGGIQEEAAYLGVPVVVLRSSTPRWEGVEAGTTTLAGLADDTASDAVLAAALAHASPAGQAHAASSPCPYGDGTAGRQIAAILADETTDALLALPEPDLHRWAAAVVTPWTGPRPLGVVVDLDDTLYPQAEYLAGAARAVGAAAGRLGLDGGVGAPPRWPRSSPPARTRAAPSTARSCGRACPPATCPRWCRRWSRPSPPTRRSG